MRFWACRAVVCRWSYVYEQRDWPHRQQELSSVEFA